MIPRIILSNQPHRIERGHLWVYCNEIQEIRGELNDGDLAGVRSRLNCRTENMFDYLCSAQEAKEQFDLIILDPPSFSRSRKAVSEARRGYKEIHLRAFKMLQGFVFTVMPE